MDVDFEKIYSCKEVTRTAKYISEELQCRKLIIDNLFQIFSIFYFLIWVISCIISFNFTFRNLSMRTILLMGEHGELVGIVLRIRLHQVSRSSEKLSDWENRNEFQRQRYCLSQGWDGVVTVGPSVRLGKSPVVFDRGKLAMKVRKNIACMPSFS